MGVPEFGGDPDTGYAMGALFGGVTYASKDLSFENMASRLPISTFRNVSTRFPYAMIMSAVSLRAKVVLTLLTVICIPRPVGGGPDVLTPTGSSAVNVMGSGDVSTVAVAP